LPEALPEALPVMHRADLSSPVTIHQLMRNQRELEGVHAHDTALDRYTRIAFSLLITYQDQTYPNDVTIDNLNKAYSQFLGFVQFYDKECPLTGYRRYLEVKDVIAEMKDTAEFLPVYSLWTCMNKTERSRQELVIAIENDFVKKREPKMLPSLLDQYHEQLNHENDACLSLDEYLKSGPWYVLFGEERRYFPARSDYEKLLDDNSMYFVDTYEYKLVHELLARLWVFVSKLPKAKHTAVYNQIISALWECYDVDDGHRVGNAEKMQRLAIQVLQGRLEGVAISIDETGNQRMTIDKAMQLFFLWHKRQRCIDPDYQQAIVSMQYTDWQRDLDRFCFENSYMYNQAFYEAFLQNILNAFRTLGCRVPDEWESPCRYALRFWNDESHRNIVRRSRSANEQRQCKIDWEEAQDAFRRQHSFLTDRSNFQEFQKILYSCLRRSPDSSSMLSMIM